MKTWICTTLTNFLGPNQGASRLYAYEKAQGHDVSLKDYNQNAFFKLLEKPNLERVIDEFGYSLEAINSSVSFRQNLGSILTQSSNQEIRNLLSRAFWHNSQFRWLEKGSPLTDKPILTLISSRLKPENLVYALMSEKAAVLGEIEKSRRQLDKEWFKLGPEEFLKNFRTLLCGKAILDAAYFPAQLDFGFGMGGNEYAPTVKDIVTSATDERHNFLIPFFLNQTLPEFRIEQPGIVGISITHTSDLVPAFTLAKLLKQENPHVHVTLGGATLTEIAYKLIKNPALFEFFDSLIIGPGEKAFSVLIQRAESGKSFNDVPNLFYKVKNNLLKSEISEEFDLNEAVTPEYVVVRPNSTLPLETSSGCYWGKCIFCYYPRMGTADLDNDFGAKRVRKMELVLKDFDVLKKAYNPLCIGLTDSCVPPARLEQIAEHNLKSKEPLKFSAFIRFEHQFESLSFCQKLAKGGFLGGQIGLESGCQRVNDVINKGVNLEKAGLILKTLYRADILAHLYTMVGLPGETESEARMTHSFIRQWHKELTLGWQIYPLWVMENGPLAQRSTEFSLKITPYPDDVLTQVTDCVQEKGMTLNEAYGLAISFNEDLNRFAHPLTRLLDAETQKLWLLAEHASGVSYSTLRRICRSLIK